MRSAIHLLSILAERLEDSSAPEAVIKAIRLLAKDKAVRRMEHRDQSEHDERRNEQQRSLFATLPDCHSKDRLKHAMMQRAYDLLWDADTCGADALLEFLPSADAERTLNAWSNDFESEGPRSEFYGETKP